MEISPREMLSVMGMLTPFSDFNQSPRNMYQCQVGKKKSRENSIRNASAFSDGQANDGLSFTHNSISMR